MFDRAVYRLKSYLIRRALERAHPELRELNQAEAKARKAHGKTRQIQARKCEIMRSALGGRAVR